MAHATAEIRPELTTRRSTGGWRGWAILWGVVVVCEIALLAGNGWLDTWTWCATRWAVGDREYYAWTDYHAVHANDAAPAFYMTAPPPMNARFYGRTQRLWEVLKTFGEGWMAVVIVALIGVYDRRKWWMAGGAALAMALAAGLGALIRIVDGRFRPTHIDGANQWELWRGFHDGKDLSFPSGHSTFVFATAAVLTYLSPRGRWVFIAVASGCAVSRVVMGAHFWSDVIFGAALGWTVGWVVTAGAVRVMEKQGDKETGRQVK